MCVFKKVLLILMVCVLLMSTSLTFAAGTNLAKNESFEKGAILPDQWDKKMYDNNASEFLWETGDAHTGNRFVTIVNNKPNHARFSQVVKVKPNTEYKISCWIKATGIPTDKVGAGMGMENAIINTDSVHDTGGKWQYHEVYGLTGNGQDSMEITVALGDYGSVNTGKASFDDVAVEEATQAPAGVTVHSLYTQPSNSNNSGDTTKKIPGDPFNKLPKEEWTFLAIVVLLVYILFAIYYLYFYKPKKAIRTKIKNADKASGR